MIIIALAVAIYLRYKKNQKLKKARQEKREQEGFDTLPTQRRSLFSKPQKEQVVIKMQPIEPKISQLAPENDSNPK